MDIAIRPPSRSERIQWKELWSAYLAFYEIELPPGGAEILWDRIFDPSSRIECHVAEQGGHLIGLVHFLAREDTWDSRHMCYLEDLYVDESHRGDGIGEKLISSVVEVAEQRGWAAVYWITAEDNHVARGLYDKLTGGPSGFIQYEIDMKTPSV
jgi:ribosomal protein S18 acetylase RimI-like enzyme